MKSNRPQLINSEIINGSKTKGVEDNNAEADEDLKKERVNKIYLGADDTRQEKGITNQLTMEIFQKILRREVTGKAIQKPDIFMQNREACLYQRDLKAHTGCVNAVDFSPCEKWIVSGGDDLKVRLWKTVDCCTKEAPALSSITMNSIHLSNIFAIRFSHKSERIYSAGNDHRLLVHDISTRERLRTYRALSSIYHIATHPSDDNVIAASSDDRNVYLFDLRGNEGDGLCTKLRQDGCAYSVCWNPQNHHYVAVCNEKKGLLVYDLRMGNNNYVEAGDITKKAICADWSPNGDAIFCVISKSNPICFNLGTSKHVQLHDPKYSNLCTIKSCAFAGQNYLVTGSDDWNIYVWKMPTKWEQDDDNGEEMVVDHAYTVLKGHRSIVNHVKFGERSNLLLSCGVEKIIKCWSPLPLFDSYNRPKQRERFKDLRLLPYFEFMETQEESDTEENFSTLNRFDFYYEVESLRMRHNDPVLDTDESDMDDTDMEEVFYQMNRQESDEDQESYFSEITDIDEMQSPTPHSPQNPTNLIPDENINDEEGKGTSNFNEEHMNN